MKKFTSFLSGIFCFFHLSPSHGTDHDPYGSLKHSFPGRPPHIMDYPQCPAKFIDDYVAYTRKCYSYMPFQKGEKFYHDVSFSIVRHHTRDNQNPPHVSLIDARRFVTINGYERPIHGARDITRGISLPHLFLGEHVKESENAFHYRDGHLYQSVSLIREYEIPSIPQVPGMNSLIYQRIVRQQEGQEIPILAMEMFEEDDFIQTLDNGSYALTGKHELANPYVYSSGEAFFLTRFVSICCERLPMEASREYELHYVEKTDDNFPILEGYESDNFGFPEEGLYQRQDHSWVKINENFERSGEPPITFTHEERSPFLDEIFFDKENPGFFISFSRLKKEVFALEWHSVANPYILIDALAHIRYPINLRVDPYFLIQKVRPLPKLTNLKGLSVWDSAIGHEGCKYLAKFKGLKKLEVRSGIGPLECQSLAELTNLKVLDVGANIIGDRGCQPLSKLRGLTRLDVGCNSIGDEGCRYLAKLTNLKELNLGWNMMGDRGCEHLTKLKGLKRLDVAFNNISDEGCQSLAELTNLKELSVGCNNIGGLGFLHLSRLTGLKKITVDPTITEGIRESLRQSLPDCDICF